MDRRERERMIDWTDAFENGAYIEGAAEYPARWARQAEAFRAAHKVERLSYGSGARQMVDLVRGGDRGLIVFVHGGYWKAFDPSYWTHLAAGGIAAGYSVALPGYTLAPDARISEITAEVAAGIACAAERVAGPLRLVGHSAGGHLVARMVTGALPSLTPRVARCVPVSGLFDLRPLRLAAMNAVLQFDEAEALSESPVFAAPPDCPVTAWVGAEERPEFLRQTRLLAETWGRAGADIGATYEPGKQHFSVIEGLAEEKSALMQAVLA